MRPPLNLGAIAKTVMATSREEPPAPELEGFSLFEYLGAGGLGRVWKAWWEERSLWVAVKVPQLDSAEAALRLRQEADALDRLQHPRIVQVYGVLPLADGRPALILELVEGASLAQVLPPDGFPVDDALDLYEAILDAVEAAHAAGVVHRDLKPANVLVATNGSLKVADFGLAAPVDQRHVQLTLTHSGMIAGSLEYLPPESFARAAAPTKAGDMYALGVILYELLAGSPPRGAWRPVSEQRLVDVRLDSLIADAMDPDPERRLASPAEAARRLREIRSTPPRHRGTPLVTLPVRILDLLWSGLGVGALIMALWTALRLDKPMARAPVTLFGDLPDFLLGWQSLKGVLLVLGAMMLWQAARGWRFRRAPLVEALPLAFGLRFGPSRTSVAVCLLTQLCLVVLPAWYAWQFWTALPWRRLAFPGWEHVLWIGDLGTTAASAWDWRLFFDGALVRLRELSFDSRGQIAVDHGRVEFHTGLDPTMIVLAVGLVLVVGLGQPVLRFLNKLGGGRQSLRWPGLALFVAGLGATAQHQVRAFYHYQRTWNLDAGPDARRYVEEREVNHFFDKCLHAHDYGNEAHMLTFYRPMVFVGHSAFKELQPRESLVKSIVDAREAEAARDTRRITEPPGGFVAPQGEDLTSGVWICTAIRTIYRETDGSPGTPGRGNAVLERIDALCERNKQTGSLEIFKESRDVEAIYDVPLLPLSREEALLWAGDFVRCLSAQGAPGLEDYFLQSGPTRHSHPVSRFVPELRADLAQFPSRRFSLQWLEGPTALRGGRHGFSLSILRSDEQGHPLDGERTLRWNIEVVYADDRWRIVTFVP